MYNNFYLLLIAFNNLLQDYNSFDNAKYLYKTV